MTEQTIIGVPKEIKPEEYRVGMTPAVVEELTQAGHAVVVEKNAGAGIGCDDAAFVSAGASILPNAKSIFDKASLIVKVKEPQPSEFPLIRKNQTLFTYLHLAPDRIQTEALLQSGCIAIAYETITQMVNGRLTTPLLAPMSEVAGRLSIQAGAHCLEKTQGGRGILLGGVPGVEKAHVLILGGGIVGNNAIKMAKGLGAEITVMDRSVDCLRALDMQYNGEINTIFASPSTIEHHIKTADLVVGAVLIPGASAPRLITRPMLSTMKQGSVLVDVSIDQGGCFETSRPTTHTDPTYVVDGIVHYCVSNMPGCVPHTSTVALNNATAHYIMRLANLGTKKALMEDQGLMNGLNIYCGQVTHPAVAKALSLNYHEPKEVMLA
jgi:alanine dehydrogenase